MKYIDVDRLRKEIDHRIDILEDMSIKCAKNDDAEMHAYYHGKAVSLQELLSFINSFQQEQQKQPQVDLEKELDTYYDSPLWDGEPVSWMTYTRIARHFYELGQLEMRHRITNPEYNAKVVEQLKSEYPARKEDSYEIH